MSDKKKKVYFEVMRVIAIFGVLFCHTGTYGISHYIEASNEVNYWLGIFLATVAQFCVPLFLLISGGVLLNREESIGYVYRHRVLKMVFATLLIVFVQYEWNYYHNPLLPPLDFDSFLRWSYQGSVAGQHWFLYAYISFLLFLPFVQKLVKAISDNKWFIYLFVAWGVFHSIFPILEYFKEWSGTEMVLAVHDFILISMLGYFLEYRCGDLFYKRKNILIILGATSLLVLVNMYLNHISLKDYDFVLFDGSFALMYAAAIFIVVKYICHQWKMRPVVEKVICFAGAGVFGCYLLEGILREIFFPVYLYLNTRIFSYPAVFIWITICVAVGVIVSNLIKRIPVISKILP